MVIIHIFQSLLGLVTMFLVYRIWSYNNQYREIVKEANVLLTAMELHEKKLTLMLYSLENRRKKTPTPKKKVPMKAKVDKRQKKSITNR